MELNREDLDLILQSLNHTKQNYVDYDKHPSYEFKQLQIRKVEDTIKKIRSLKKGL